MSIYKRSNYKTHTFSELSIHFSHLCHREHLKKMFHQNYQDVKMIVYVFVFV